MTLFNKFENEFQALHGESLNTDTDPIKNLEIVLEKKFPSQSKELIHFYSKQRLNIRMDYLNEKLQVLEKALKQRYVNHVNKY